MGKTNNAMKKTKQTVASVVLLVVAYVIFRVTTNIAIKMKDL